jgi:hypothetical protein
VNYQGMKNKQTAFMHYCDPGSLGSPDKSTGPVLENCCTDNWDVDLVAIVLKKIVVKHDLPDL